MNDLEKLKPLNPDKIFSDEDIIGVELQQALEKMFKSIFVICQREHAN